jgi:uncharacterized membrane protein YgcG
MRPMWRSSSYGRFGAFLLSSLAFSASAVGTVAGTVATTGCTTSNCDTSPESNPAADFRGGILHANEKVYETSLPDGAHLNFSAGARYRVYHQLGGRPALVQLWVSFSPTGVKGGNEAIPAGNMAEIVEANAEYVEIRNDSCGDYWLRAVLAAPVGAGVEQTPENAGGGGGASGGSGAGGGSGVGGGSGAGGS